MNDKTIDSLTLGELMGDEYSVYISKNSSFGFDLYLEDDNFNQTVAEGVHSSAMENFYFFCKKFINQFEKHRVNTNE